VIKACCMKLAHVIIIIRMRNNFFLRSSGMKTAQGLMVRGEVHFANAVRAVTVGGECIHDRRLAVYGHTIGKRVATGARWVLAVH